MVLGPEASRSGIRSFAATWIACAARMPGQMYSMGLVGIGDTETLLKWAKLTGHPVKSAIISPSRFQNCAELIEDHGKPSPSHLEKGGLIACIKWASELPTFLAMRRTGVAGA
jgi:hypothetical protein